MLLEFKSVFLSRAYKYHKSTTFYRSHFQAIIICNIILIYFVITYTVTETHSFFFRNNLQLLTMYGFIVLN